MIGRHCDDGLHIALVVAQRPGAWKSRRRRIGFAIEIDAHNIAFASITKRTADCVRMMRQPPWLLAFSIANAATNRNADITDATTNSMDAAPIIGDAVHGRRVRLGREQTASVAARHAASGRRL
jgi:hypothetical protein